MYFVAALDYFDVNGNFYKLNQYPLYAFSQQIHMCSTGDVLTFPLVADCLIGVHCTHGVNRTGYFICKYMVSQLDMTAKDAVEGKTSLTRPIYLLIFQLT